MNVVPSSSSGYRSPRVGGVEKSILSQCFDMETSTTVKPFNSEEEMEDYLTRDFQLNNDVADNIDTSKFWRDQSTVFPTLALKARQIFAIPATNTNIERLFSASTNAVSEHRTKLDQEKPNQLMFLNKNLPLLKKLEKAESETVQLKRSISNAAVTSIGCETDHTDDDVRLSDTTQSKKRRSDNE